MNAGLINDLGNLAPELRLALDEEIAWWAPDLPPVTIAAGTLATSLSVKVSHIPPEVLREIFSRCEEALSLPPTDDGDALVTGFLEGLQHADGRGDFDFTIIASYLGPKSRAHCVGMDAFYGATTRGL